MNGLNILLAAVLAAGVQPPVSKQLSPERPGYWPPEYLSGSFVGGWELSNFEGCWLEFTDEAETEFAGQVAELQKTHGKQRRFKLRMIGRRNIQPIDGPPARHGHLGAYSCRVEAMKTLSVEAVVDR